MESAKAGPEAEGEDLTTVDNRTLLADAEGLAIVGAARSDVVLERIADHGPSDDDRDHAQRLWQRLDTIEDWANDLEYLLGAPSVDRLRGTLTQWRENMVLIEARLAGTKPN